MPKIKRKAGSDSWKKIGMALAANRAQPGQMCHGGYIEKSCPVCEMKSIYRRARALRRAEKGKKP